MTRPSDPNRSADDLLFLVAVGLLGMASVGHWLVGNVAALLGKGRLLHAGVADALAALSRLSDHWGDPRHAWPEPAASNLPGPIVYWASVALVAAGAVAAGTFAMSVAGQRRHEPIDRRSRLGVAAQPHLARRKDLRPLLTARPERGRFVIARQGRRYVCTEAASCRHRRGVRGAVAVFGASQSGKTTGLVGGVTAWDGPAIISSVKADLLRASIETRSAAGNVLVFDPLGTSGAGGATWTPLRGARNLKGAMAAAQMLARAGGDDGPHDRFWRGQAEQLIAAMLWTAANTDGHSMRNVVKWVLDLDRPEGENTGTLAPLVRLLTDHPAADVAMSARQVQGWLHGQWKTDSRTTSSVYATARNAVWPWADPDVASSANGCDITLDWLLEGCNTLYLCAPLGDETRIGAVFAVLLHDLITQAFARYNRLGEPIEPRLLVLLDEAANTPLPKLPQWASTVTGAGMQLVTVWQSKAQLDQIYGRDSDNVLTNHRTKLVYPSGLSDMATIEYLSALVGKEHVRGDLDQPSWTQAGDHRPSRTPATAVPFLPPSVLRQMQVGDSLLLHGDLAPAWIRARS